jgi:hypothetical protein
MSQQQWRFSDEIGYVIAVYDWWSPVHFSETWGGQGDCVRKGRFGICVQLPL